MSTSDVDLETAVDRVLAGEEFLEVMADMLIGADDLSDAIVERARVLSGREELVLTVRSVSWLPRSLVGIAWSVLWRGELIKPTSSNLIRSKAEVTYRLDTRR